VFFVALSRLQGRSTRSACDELKALAGSLPIGLSLEKWTLLGRRSERT
jgi:hypothetical protein